MTEDVTVPQRGKGYDGMSALDSLQKIMDSEMGQQMQKKLAEGDETLTAVWEGIKDVRRVEEEIMNRLERIENHLRSGKGGRP